MKQTKRQRLATIGLCSSLVINAFSGVTAVAETVTIESSPTAESSAKEETQASSVKEETTKASTENSQVTTDTSQEEETKEAEEQAETEVPTETPEVKTDTTEQAPANSNINDLQKSISSRWVPNNQSIYPRMAFTFTDETGKAFTDENLTLSGTYYKVVRNNSTLKYYPSNGTRYSIVSSNVGNGRYQVGVNVAVPLPYDFFTNVPTGYSGNRYLIEQLKVDNTLKYVDSIVAPPGRITMTKYTTQQTSEAAQFGNYTTYGLSQRDRTFSKNSANIFSLNTALTTDPREHLNVMAVDSMSSTSGTIPILFGFDGTPTFREALNYVVTRKQVTEKFVDANGVAITPPTGFTQNKKTPMTSNDFTFKQAGTLPDTYTTGGKTYKFKGWYKGKTKPSTLTTTKAPSYAVTYDGNDDLNVVYEETKEKTTTIPAVTYKFGFVDEKGALVAPTNFNMTTNLTTIMNGTPKQVGTASGVNNGNLKQLTIPSQQLTHTPSVSPAFSGTTNFRLVVPKQYKLPTVTPGTYYTGSSTTYPIATTKFRYVGGVLPDSRLETDGKEYRLSATTTAHSYQMYRDYWIPDTTKTYFSGALSRASAEGNTPAYYTTDETMYYFLENRRVTENFVDTSGAKITPPTGFTQGKKTAITSDAYTFKQAGTLPDTYTTGGKTYKFKGWYKGKTKTEPLKTTKAPSYGVTYDDNDDLNVVYEPVEMADFPAQTYQFGFIDESGQRVDATKVGLTYDSWFGEVLTGNVADWKTVSIEKGKIAPTKNNLKEIAYPAQAFEIVSGKSSQYSAANLTFTPPRYYEKMSIYNKNGTFNTDYPLFNVKNNNSPNLIVEDSAKLLSKWFELMKSDTQSFVFNKTAPAPADVTVPAYLREVVINPINTTTKSNYYTLDKPVYYYLTNRRVTENFVDTSGAKITPPTGFTQGKQTVINSDPYTFKQAGTLPDTYTTGGKTYKFKGWYKGKSILNTLTTTKAPSYQVTYDDNDDLNVVYEEEIPTASVTLTRPKEVIDTNTNVIWTTTITNTSKAPLQNLTLKKGPNWSAGVSLPNAVPIGKKVSVAFTTRATGKPNTVLKAEVVVFGGIKDRTVDNFVRIRPNDQEVVTPTTEGFISVPTFDFGQVGVAGSKQQHSLKQAADYYGNGTRNPYLRIKKTQPNWSLTAQLSQPKSATDSLPTATRLLLGAAPVSSFTNYNQPTELKNAVGTTSAISLTANNTATSIIANKQFTGSNVYQLDFTFNNVKLEVPANQGVKGQQYKAAVTWNLVTGP